MVIDVSAEDDIQTYTISATQTGGQGNSFQLTVQVTTPDPEGEDDE